MAVRELYNRLSSNYDARHQSPTTAAIREREKRLLEKFAKGRILDLGCGTGFHLQLLSGMQAKACGLDISEGMLKKSKERGLAGLVQGNAETLPFANQAFDTVICLFATLNICDLGKALAEMARISKQGSLAIVSFASVYDNNYALREKLSGKKLRFRKAGIEKQKLGIRLYEKEEVVKAFGKAGYVMELFDAAFIAARPNWNNYNPLGAWTKLALFVERYFPDALKKYGCLHYFVFRKA
ncbi:MAG: class I SAM-dependent methyltransferase [Candidatus Aenigmarchaeota archaeon]|nr:class I SAM-dependent methyltransferase [Candidatus Aenigmarchaeota archaeon]